MDGERPRPARRKRIDGTILFGAILSALLHAIGIALLLMTPTRVQPTAQTAYSVEVVDPDALGGDLLAGPIGGPASGEQEEPDPDPEPAVVPPPPEPAKPEVIAKVESPPEPEADAVPLETARPTPTANVTAVPTPKPTAPKVVATAKRTPVRKPVAVRTAAPAPKKAVAVAKKAPKPAATPGERVRQDAGRADATQDAEADLDRRLSDAINGLSGLSGHEQPGSGRGGTAESQTGPPGVGGEGPGGGGQLRGIEFVAYYTQMLARIKARWAWAGDGADRRVTVRFGILPSGDIANLRLVERSGDASYDASVQRAIKGASPFAPPPKAYQRDFADVELTFRPADLGVSG